MSEERNARKVYQGRVVSDKMDKTITVDTVQIMETRPLSAKKRFRLVKIVEKAATL